MIRAAKAVDIPQIVALLNEGHARSRFATEVAVDEAYAKQFLHRMVMLNGGRGESGVGHFVAEQDGKIVGHIIGHKNRIGEIGDKFYTSDSLFYVAKDASPFTHIGLIRAFVKWSGADPRVIRVIPGVSDFIQSYETAAQIYETLGFSRMGVILERRIERAEVA